MMPLMFWFFFPSFSSSNQTCNVISEASTSVWNVEYCKLAENLMICTTKSIIAFILTKGLTTSLQKKAKDICQAYSEVSSTVTALSEVRATTDAKHKEWFDTAIALGQMVDAPPPQLPRHCSRQTAPGIVIHLLKHQRFTTSVTLLPVFLFSNQFISHLNSQLSDIQQKAIMEMKIVPSVLMDNSLPASSTQLRSSRVLQGRLSQLF